MKIHSINKLEDFDILRGSNELWTYATNKEGEVYAEEYEGEYNYLTMNELVVALKCCTNTIATGSDGFTIELYTYGGDVYKRQTNEKGRLEA